MEIDRLHLGAVYINKHQFCTLIRKKRWIRSGFHIRARQYPCLSATQVKQIPCDRSAVLLALPVEDKSAKCLAINPNIPAMITEILHINFIKFGHTQDIARDNTDLASIAGDDTSPHGGLEHEIDDSSFEECLFQRRWELGHSSRKTTINSSASLNRHIRGAVSDTETTVLIEGCSLQLRRWTNRRATGGHVLITRFRYNQRVCPAEERRKNCGEEPRKSGADENGKMARICTEKPFPETDIGTIEPECDIACPIRYAKNC